jgi:phosphate uptake regulator
MKRKMVSLPSKWARSNGAKKGDEIEVIEFEKKLILAPIAPAGLGIIDIDVSGFDAIDTRILGALYKSGYDEIKVNFSSIEELRRIQEVIREEFIGFEIIDQRKNYLIFKKVSSIEPKEFNTMVRRIFLMTIAAAEDCLKAAKAKDYEWLQSIVLNDKNINKVTDFCRRVLNTTGTDQYKKLPPGYYIIEQLEKIADYYKEMARYIIEKQILPSKELEKMFNDTVGLFDRLHHLYFKFDLKELNEFVKERKRFDVAFSALYESASKKEVKLVHYLNGVVDSAFDMNGALLAVNL